MTKAEMTKKNAELVKEFLKNGGKIEQVPAKLIKPCRKIGAKYSSIAHVGRKKITVMRQMSMGV